MYSEYKTTDIVLAAFLRLKGGSMLGIEKQGQKGTFVFENISDSLVREYDLGNGSVEPVAFNNAIKQLTTSVRRMD
jgi:hypothetical protein